MTTTIDPYLKIVKANENPP